jgi:hypothetical protein
MTSRLRVALGCALVSATTLTAQSPALSGTWKLDQARSRITAAAGLAGLAASGAPETLHVTQPANGSLVVESQINESHARVYVPGVQTTTPVTVGPPGTVSVTSRREGRSFVGEGTRESVSGPAKVVTAIREVYAVSADGATLTVDVEATSGNEKSASTLVYRRTGDVSGCRSWPTPCKTQ